MQAEREGGSCAPQIPDLCGCGGTVSRRAGAVLPRAVRSRAGAGRSLGLFRAAGDGGSGAAALPPSPAPTGWRRGPRGTRRRGLGADPAALPAACGGAASETVPGWKWRVPLRGFPVWKPGSALCPPCTGTGGCKRWRFQRQGCRWAPFLTGLCIEGMLLSTDEIFYTKCKGGGWSTGSRLSFTVVLWILTTSVCRVREPNQRCFATDLGYLIKRRTWVLSWSKLSEFCTTVFNWISLSLLMLTQPCELKVHRINVFSVCM